MSFDALVALAVLVIMFGLLFGIILWARGAPVYDDGRAADYVTYVPEPDDPRRLPGEGPHGQPTREATGAPIRGSSGVPNDEPRGPEGRDG
jgi:hypothetical protein